MVAPTLLLISYWYSYGVWCAIKTTRQPWQVSTVEACDTSPSLHHTAIGDLCMMYNGIN